jgi:hypothetical protein
MASIWFALTPIAPQFKSRLNGNLLVTLDKANERFVMRLVASPVTAAKDVA